MSAKNTIQTKLALVCSVLALAAVVVTAGIKLVDAQTGSDAGFFSVTPPARAMDTRVGIGGASFAAGADRALTLPIPAGATGVALNVTVTGTTGGGYLTVYPGNAARPNTSNLNFGPGQTVPNAVVVGVSASTIRIYNFGGTTDVIVDVMGYFGGGGVNALSNPIGSGTWLVNTQVAPGQYIGSVPPGKFCYWGRLTSPNGTIIANDFVTGPAQVIMVVASTDGAIKVDAECNFRLS